MIDRAARHGIASLLMALRDGAITYPEFEDRSYIQTRDRAIADVRWAMFNCANELDGTIEGQAAMEHERARALVDVCLLFLGSEREYPWARWRMVLPDPLRRLSLDGTRWDFACWPFRNREELDLEKLRATGRSYRDPPGAR